MTDERTGTGELRLDAYYYGFDSTGVASIDKFLSAVACAGKSFHHTQDWTESVGYENEPHTGSSPVEWIQNAASEAAEEIERLQAALKPFAEKWPERPESTDSYVGRQYVALRNADLANSTVSVSLADCKRAAEVLK